MFSVAVAEQLLTLAVELYLIIIGVVRVAALLTVTEEDDGAVQGVNLLDTTCHQTVALGDAVQQFACLSVVEVIVATARAVAPPQHLTTVVQQVEAEHIDIDVGTADLADDDVDITGLRVDAAKLKGINRTAASQEVLVDTLLVVVHLDEVVAVGSNVERTAFASIGIVPIEAIAADAVAIRQGHLLLFQTDGLVHLVDKVQILHVGIVVDHAEIGVPFPEARGIAFIQGVLRVSATVGGILPAIKCQLAYLAATVVTDVEIVAVAKHGKG